MSESSDDIPEKDPETGRFVTGNIGGGRPKGSRNKLGEQFFVDLFADWKEHGAVVISRVREERPAEYLRVVAGTLPKELHIKSESIDDLSDDELMDILATLRSIAADSRANAHREDPGSPGEDEELRSKPH
jgi:hypothetical protein